MFRPFALALALAGCTVPPMAGQSPVPRIVIFEAGVRTILEDDWDRHAAESPQLERAYCLTFRRDIWVVSDWVWLVTGVERARNVKGATPTSIQSFECPTGADVTVAHTHPFQTCVTDTDCVPGGLLAGQCFPSDIDRRSLARSGRPFAVVICARTAYVGYFP